MTHLTLIEVFTSDLMVIQYWRSKYWLLIEVVDAQYKIIH